MSLQRHLSSPLRQDFATEPIHEVYLYFAEAHQDAPVQAFLFFHVRRNFRLSLQVWVSNLKKKAMLMSFLLVLALALIHLFGGRLSFLAGTPRSIWLSMAGGVSVAFIFLHLLPELSDGQEVVKEALGSGGFLDSRIYLFTLLGLIVFYGLERAALSSKKRSSREKGVKQSGEAQPNEELFWLHISSFAVYNEMIGYLLFQRKDGPLLQMVLFAVAMALHFIVNDFGLQQHYHRDYRKNGRWLLVVSILVGWGIGLVLELPQYIISLTMAFIGGGVILNVLKEELPEERESRFWAFLLGAFVYALLLLAL